MPPLPPAAPPAWPTALTHSARHRALSRGVEEGLAGGPAPCQGGPGRLHPHCPHTPQLLSCPRGPAPRGEATSIYSPFVPPPVAFLWDLLSPPAPMAGSPKTPAGPLQTWVTGVAASAQPPWPPCSEGAWGPGWVALDFWGVSKSRGWGAARACARVRVSAGRGCLVWYWGDRPVGAVGFSLSATVPSPLLTPLAPTGGLCPPNAWPRRTCPAESPPAPGLGQEGPRGWESPRPCALGPGLHDKRLGSDLN